MYKPDYNSLRDETPFTWFIATANDILLEITQINEKEFFLNPSAGIEVFKKGCPIIKEMFGPDVGVPWPMTPPVSYGHINTLGAELIFPDHGQANHSTLCATLEEGIKILKKDIDFAKSGMVPFYMDYLRKMQEAFPEEYVAFVFKAEGPLTTAYTLRRDNYFYDFYDNPELTKEFLELITASVVKYNRFVRKINGQAEISPQNAALADDCAAMLSPELWSEFVVPYHEQWFRGLTTGKRFAHIEDVRPGQLPFLEELLLDRYDPSVSAQLTPEIIRERIRVPFTWRLLEFCLPYLTVEDVADFVYQAAADGASRIYTYVSHGMYNNDSVKKMHAFAAACKHVKEMLEKGVTREEIGKLVSPSGRKKFWDDWPVGNKPQNLC